ncbi:OmpP1/FadL family transporter [Polyangium aurulentum]|uniref:OmpP1/FadL family transporter n=1 Tax=Polyangium aurulentum TaxID=2567896 RepID=UPI0010AEB301|nr:hypothetical protein [Polyangium aurulentum]UQA61593.1 outer membrane protein transport protein [Polyangium aurulentum]
MSTSRVVIGGLLTGLVCLSASGTARASSGIDSPESGVVQAGRGGTGVARADDPLAAYFNPAAIASMKSGVHLGAHLMFFDQCFTRLGPGGQPVSPGGGVPGPGAPGGPAAAVCSEGTPFPNPQLAATFRVHRQLAIGLAVLGPHAAGNAVWPESIPYTNQVGVQTTQPSPQRYLLTEQDALIINPTLSIGYAINDKFSIGAGFVWGIASIDFVNFTQAVSATNFDDFNANGDVKAHISAFDGFIPGVVVGLHASPIKRLDLAAWFKWQDAVRTRTSLRLESAYWKAGGQKNDNPCPNLPADCNITENEDAGTLKFQIPMEARVGVRYHHPRRAGSLVPKTGPRVRDSIAEDLFDVELNFTWAHNSDVDNLEVRFDPGTRVNVPGGSPAEVPPNADIPHNWKDVLGVRLGGDFVVIPGFIALRAGGFFETNGQDPAYLNPDFHLGYRIGVGGGATVRIGPVDVSLAYQHTFYETLDNGGDGRVKALSGDATPGLDFRSRQAINGGRLESSLNEIALGGTFRF